MKYQQSNWINTEALICTAAWSAFGIEFILDEITIIDSTEIALDLTNFRLFHTHQKCNFLSIINC